MGFLPPRVTVCRADSEAQLARANEPHRGEGGERLGDRCQVEPRLRGDLWLVFAHGKAARRADFGGPAPSGANGNPGNHGGCHLLIDEKLAGQLIQYRKLIPSVSPWR